MSNLPPAARRQVQEANRQVEALRNGQNPNAPAPASSEPPPNLPNVGAQVPSDARPVDLSTRPQRPAPMINLQPAPAQPQPTQVRQPAAPVQSNEPPPDAVDGQPVNYEHRFKVMQGKYTAETRRAAQRIQELERQNAVLIDRVAQPAPAAPAAPAPAPQTPEQRALALGFTKAEIAEYGPELVEIMIRTNERFLNQRLAPLENSQRQLQGAVHQSVQQIQKSARDLVYDALLTQVPNWAEVNVQPDFIDWLNQNDIFSGQTRYQGLMRAFEVNDAPRVIGIFRAFLEESERERSTARPARLDPATLVAPGQPLGGAAPAPMDGNQSKRIWLESEVGNFYSNVRQGVYRHNPDEKARLEAEIHLAAAEGRVRPTINDASLSNAR